MLVNYNNIRHSKSDIDWRIHTLPSNGRRASPLMPSGVLSLSPYRPKPCLLPPSHNSNTSHKHIDVYSPKESKVHRRSASPETRIVPFSPPSTGNRIVSLPPNCQADHVKQFPNVSDIYSPIMPSVERVILRDGTQKYISGPMKRITRELNVNNAFPDQLTRAAAKEALRMKSSALMGRSPIRAQSPPKVPNSRVASDMWANSHNSPIEYNRKYWGIGGGMIIPLTTTVIQHSQCQPYECHPMRLAAADGIMTTYASMGTTSLQNGSGNGCDSSLSPSRCSIPIWEPPANDGYNHGLHGQPLDCSTPTNTNISTPVTTVSTFNHENKLIHRFVVKG